MYKIMSNKAATYSCTCPQCDSYFLFTQSELNYNDPFSELAYFDCPCCGAVLTNDKAVKMSKMSWWKSSFDETII